MHDRLKLELGVWLLKYLLLITPILHLVAYHIAHYICRMSYRLFSYESGRKVWWV